jgi:hypothetical protein
VSLVDLNMSSNKIGRLKEVLYLQKLNQLRHIQFSDPHYGENPICNLCNYQTYVLFHLVKLEKLDTLQISDEAKTFAETTFMKKRMYYNMRIKTIQRNASNLIKLIKMAKKVKCYRLSIDFKELTKKLLDTLREIEERQLLPKALQKLPKPIVAFL